MATPRWKVKAAQQIFRASRIKGNPDMLRIDLGVSMDFGLEFFECPIRILERLRSFVSGDLDEVAKRVDLLTHAKTELAYRMACGLLAEQIATTEGYETNLGKKTAQGGE